MDIIGSKGLSRSHDSSSEQTDYLLFVFTCCVKAEAATRLTAADDLGSRSSFAAVDATLAEVFSLLGFLVGITIPLTVWSLFKGALTKSRP